MRRQIVEYSSLLAFRFALFFLLSSVFGDQVGLSGKGFPPDGEYEKSRDEMGFDAIRQLHKQMDDDHSGNIDVNESSEFVREELHIKEKDRLNRRQKTFHLNDDNFISVDDLWIRWLRSSERNWTVEETLDWLREAVELPQYAPVFQANAVDGATLPRLAIQNAGFLANVLKISNPVHRQKLQLKAMDVVLFGYRLRKSNYWKDAMLVGCVTLALFLMILNRHQQSKARGEVSRLAEQKADLLSAQESFQRIQEKMQEEIEKKEKSERSARDDDSKKQAEVNTLKQQLENAERRIEQGVMVSGFAPLALQPLLRKTCELEMARINRAVLESRSEMKEAIETVEKLRKKQASVLYSMKMAVGSGSETGNLDHLIGNIKSKMEQTARSMEECQHRWTQIESLCGYPILDGSHIHTGHQPHNGVVSQLTSLPLALTSALAAVPNAFGVAQHKGSSAGFMRPTLVTPTIDEDEESGSIVPQPPGLIQPKIAPQFHGGRPVQRSMVNFQTAGTVPVPLPATTTLAPSLLKSASIFTQRPQFSLGENTGIPRMGRSESADNFGRFESSTVSSSLAGVPPSSSSTSTRPPAPRLEAVGKTDSQDSSGTGGSLGGAGTEEQKAKKRAKFMGFLAGKKEKG